MGDFVNNDYASVKYIDFKPYQRVIVISDIHGDLKGFNGLLKTLDFKSSDALVIVGDILEKGSDSLKLLQKVMQLSECGNLYMVLGNNDVLFEEWFSDEISDLDIHGYMNFCKRSILIEMAKQLDMPYQTLEDVGKLKTAIKKNYAEEIAYLHELPYIIDSDRAVFVHAGIKPTDLYKQNREYCLSAKAFGNQKHRFEKMLIVGHWPASNYRKNVIDVNSYYNADTNVWSIDGGSSLKEWQQINYLIFEDEDIKSGFYDYLPKVRILDNQPVSEHSITLIFPHTELKVREKFEEQSRCYVPYLNKEMLIDNHEIYDYKGKVYCEDFTSYNLEVKENEIVSCCLKTKDGILIKKNGIVGNYKGRYEFIENNCTKDEN